VDLHYEGTDGQLKSTFVVAPGADPGQIRWRYEGAAGVQVDAATGDLVITLPPAACTVVGVPCPSLTAPLVERAPVAWQERADLRVPVEVRFTVAPDGSLGFELPGGYDPDYPLVLDPLLVYSTYLGGGSGDFGRG